MSSVNSPHPCSQTQKSAHLSSSQPGSGQPCDSYLLDLPLEDLRPHPGFAAHGIVLNLDKASALVELREEAFAEPLDVTESGVILDGFTRWRVARRQHRKTLMCRVRPLDEQEALLWILRRQRPSCGLPQVSRILLALDLEDALAAQAKENQRIGGTLKGSSNLANLRCDVRKSLSEISGASAGNVDKVKLLKNCADPILLNAVKANEVSIDRAWRWVKDARDGGRGHFRNFSEHREIEKTISKLMRQHRRAKKPTTDALKQIRDGLKSARLLGLTIGLEAFSGLACEVEG